MMMLESLLVSPTSRAGYLSKIGDVNGLQMGDPALGDDRVTVHLYPGSGITYHTIVFGETSRKEIEEILGRIRSQDTHPSNHCEVAHG